MQPDFWNRDALHRVHLEHARDEIPRQLRQVRGGAVDPALDLLEEAGDRFIVEWQRPAKQRVEDDTAGPHIDLGTGVEMPADDLGRSIVGRPAGCPQKVPVPHQVGKAKVGNFDVQIGIQQEILRLQVAMGNLLEVAVLDSRNDLVEEVAGLVSRQASFGHDVIEQLSSGNVLDDEEDIGGRVDDFVESDDVRVRAQVQDVDLALDLFLHAKLLDLGLVQDLHRDLVPRDHMGCQFDLSKGTDSQTLAQDELSNLDRRLLHDDDDVLLAVCAAVLLLLWWLALAVVLVVLLPLPPAITTAIMSLGCQYSR
mmetsp:Transcript_26940/g.75743  ORF Transcript_26940/g.75743 Transcript_26940/m.75743 type:complete len:310 (-) Transcript_26940:208-1137(-)